MVCHKGVSFREQQDGVFESRMVALGKLGWSVIKVSLSFPTGDSLTPRSLQYPGNVQRSHSKQQCHFPTPQQLSVKPQPCFQRSP